MSPSGKVALVTGGAVRVGRAIVEELAGAGWVVAFTYRSSAGAAQELAGRLQAQGQRTLALEADLDESGARSAVAHQVEATLGGLDALVNSAAVFRRTPVADLDEQRLAAALRTNLEAPLFLALACREMLRSRRGSVVNIVDIYGSFPLRDYLAYSVSKAALIAATRSLAVELAPEVRVNAVAPGIAIFPADYDAATRDRLLARTLLRREGSAAEVAGAVRYLLEGTQTMTGQVLTIDGGRTIAL
jgi:pteridine reductase